MTILSVIKKIHTFAKYNTYNFFLMTKYMPLYFALSKSKIIKGNGEILLQDELVKLWHFLNMLTGSRYSTIIMRGESNENLREQYNYDTNTPDLLAQCIFMAGEKGRICWNEKKFLDPDDTSVENFCAICKTLNKSIKEGRKSGNTNRTQKIQDFFSRNQEFCSTLEDIETLAGKYRGLPIDVRKKVNLYYLSIAHTINSHKYRKASSFVSTTTNPQVADLFTNDATIYGWVPRVTMERTMQNQIKPIEYVLTTSKPDIKQFGFPCCDTPVYPTQKEISLRCGILPHFIIGFQAGCHFYVNPAIFSTMNKLEEIDSFQKLCAFKKHLLLYGLDIDQSDFEEFCRKTNFKRYYTYNGDKYHLHRIY